MPAIDVDVVRALSAAPELRGKEEGDDDSLGVMTGHFSIFDNWYRVSSIFEGEFMERTARGFSAEALTVNAAIMRCMFDHGFDPQIGNKSLGTFLDLREDDEGSLYKVSLFNTSYNRDLYPGLKANQYGASFRMKVQEDSWVDEPDPSDYNPRGLPERTIIRADVSELGPVAWPANPKATATVHSATDQFYNLLRQRDHDAFEEAVRAAGIPLPDFSAAEPRRTRDGGRGHDSGPGNGARSQPSEEALRRHHELILKGVIRK